MSIIILENIKFAYGKDSTKLALKDVNFSIEEGDFLSILGPNGSGKSTIIKIITGFLNPQYGDIKLCGESLRKYKPIDIAKRIAYVPQLPISTYPFSVYEIIAMGRYPYLNMSGFEKVSDREKIAEIIELLELRDVAKKGINEISGGEAQRTFIARALAQEPDILLLDEPNAHLDIKHQLSIFNLLKKLNDEKKLTIITVMHDLNLARFYSNKVLLLKNGCVYLMGDTQSVITSQNIKSVFDVQVDIQHDDKNEIRSVLINPEFTSIS